RQSLLLRAQTGETDAWQDLTDLYRPLILGWLNRQGVPAGHPGDLRADHRLSVDKHLPTFPPSRHQSSIRSCLPTSLCSRTADYWRGIDAGAQASGGSGAVAALQQIADPDSDLNRRWDEEHDRYVLQCLLDLVEEEFEPVTLRAFRRLAFDGVSGAEAAQGAGAVRGVRLRGQVTRPGAHPPGGGRAHRLTAVGHGCIVPHRSCKVLRPFSDTLLGSGVVVSLSDDPRQACHD